MNITPRQFFPDKPRTSSPAVIKYVTGTATAKMDGYNCLLCVTGGKAETWSRAWNLLPVDRKIVEEFVAIVRARGYLGDFIVQCEWMKLRSGGTSEFKYEGQESLFAITPYVIDGQPVISWSFKQRREWLEQLGIPVDDLSVKDSKDLKGSIWLPACSDNPAELYERTVGVKRTEGVVVCGFGGSLLAQQTSSGEPTWLQKFKWRRGDSGLTEYKG